MKVCKIIIYIFLFLFVFAKPEVTEGNVEDTKHNLSASGPGPVKAVREKQICIFCHQPQNRLVSKTTYIPYTSSTLYATVGQPTGASKMCLSCHDGTIALGAHTGGKGRKNRFRVTPFVAGIRFMPEGASKLETDLSDDHPVSFVYDVSLAVENGELAMPSSLPPEIKLDNYGQLQCTACHDPHSDDYEKFLVMPNDYSNLCKACHRINGWESSSHAASNTGWNGAGTDPWPHTPYNTVSATACENCHMPHTAGGSERLLNYVFEEDNCIACHNGNVADTDIEKELAKNYLHAVQDYVGIHDPVEDFSSGRVRDHVECSDCHNPHWTNSNVSSAPQVAGANSRVTGVDISGQQIPVSNYQYQICFKCHADSNVKSLVHIDRNLQQLNTRLEFLPSNPSYHPVITKGVNENVPSLTLDYSTASILYCTDCHSNDNTRGPAGPHGSINEYLLEKNYTTQDYTQENSYNYALCYKCHERNSILNNESFSTHKLHIVDEKTTCSTCHDAHGISNTQGNAINNSNLINFDLTIVQPDSQGRIQFEDTGLFTGRCFLNCHGSIHEPKEYP